MFQLLERNYYDGVMLARAIIMTLMDLIKKSCLKIKKGKRHVVETISDF